MGETRAREPALAHYCGLDASVKHRIDEQREAQKMLCELLLRRKLDHEAAKAGRPNWGYRHGSTRS